MGDADETYPLQELAPFVDKLEEGDDLVIGSRFEGTIHGDAMPFLNRFVGNPILTGMLNVLFGVKVSDAHCGMRAIRRDALPALDLHSTGMEFASEMVFKAYRRGLTVSEIPIDYYPRVGESKLNRFGDAWRHVRFMLLYSPSWLYLVPGIALLLLGVAGMLVLATGPVDVFGRSWQIHTMLGFVALTLIGAQVIQLGVFARTYARVRIGERDPLLERLGRGLSLERGLLVGGILVFLAVAGLFAIGAEWAADGFGTLGRAYETALLATVLGLGIQVIFGAFFLALLTMPLRRRRARPPTAASDLGRHPGQGRRRRSRALPHGYRSPGHRPRLSRCSSSTRARPTAAPSSPGAWEPASRRSRRPSSDTGARGISEPSSHAATSSSSRARTRTQRTRRGSSRWSRPCEAGSE